MAVRLPELPEGWVWEQAGPIQPYDKLDGWAPVHVHRFPKRHIWTTTPTQNPAWVSMQALCSCGWILNVYPTAAAIYGRFESIRGPS